MEEDKKNLEEVIVTRVDSSVGPDDTAVNTEIMVNKSSDDGDVNRLSKRQIKKRKKAEKWLERKGEKRLKERIKAKERRAFKKANNIKLGPTRKELKRSTMADSDCKLNVTIDMSFDDLMIDKDIAKLIKQILRCYTLNRRAIAPLQFSLTNFNGKSVEQIKKHNGYENWDVKFHSTGYLDLFPKDKLVYLTSESDNVIDTLDPTCVYVIGGLVDHNSQKGLCHKTAISQGIQHGRLPLDKFLKMKARKVLTVDHVFEIILRITEGKTWQETFLQVLPERKNAELIQNNVRHNMDCFESNNEPCDTEMTECDSAGENTHENAENA